MFAKDNSLTKFVKPFLQIFYKLLFELLILKPIFPFMINDGYRSILKLEQIVESKCDP